MALLEMSNIILNKIKNALKKAGKFIVDVVKLYLKNDLPVFAGAASFFLIISSIPLFMIVLSTMSLLPMVDVEDFIANINLLFPHIPYVRHLVEYLMQAARELSSSNVIYMNLLISLISGSTCLMSFVIGIRKLHGIKHTSNYLLIKFMTIINILILYLTIILTIIFFIVGRFVLGYVNIYIPIASDIIAKILAYRYLTVGIALFVLMSSLYMCCTNFQRKYKKNVLGALFVPISWVAVSNLFSMYYANFNIHTGIYESLTGTIIAFIWLFVCANLVFIGACINEIAFPHHEII